MNNAIKTDRLRMKKFCSKLMNETIIDNVASKIEVKANFFDDQLDLLGLEFRWSLFLSKLSFIAYPEAVVRTTHK